MDLKLTRKNTISVKDFKGLLNCMDDNDIIACSVYIESTGSEQTAFKPDIKIRPIEPIGDEKISYKAIVIDFGAIDEDIDEESDQ